MKQYVLIASLVISTSSIATELHNFNEVKNAITTGKSIHIIVNFTTCASSVAKAQQALIGTFTPNATVVTIPGYIATSLTHFTLNNPYFPGKPVYEFVKYKIGKDNIVNISHQILDATNYVPLSDQVSINCGLGSDVKIYD